MRLVCRIQTNRVQSTFLQPRKYDGLLLTGWKNGMAQWRVALHRLQMTGSRMSCIFLTSRLGTGSREYDFDGILAKILATSEQLTGEM